MCGSCKRGSHTSLALLRNQHTTVQHQPPVPGTRTAARTAQRQYRQTATVPYATRGKTAEYIHFAHGRALPSNVLPGRSGPQPAMQQRGGNPASLPRKSSSSLLFWILHARPFAPQHLAGSAQRAEQHETITRRGIKITNFARRPALACLALSWRLEPLT